MKYYRPRLTQGQLDLLISALAEYKSHSILRNNRIMYQAAETLQQKLARCLVRSAYIIYRKQEKARHGR